MLQLSFAALPLVVLFIGRLEHHIDVLCDVAASCTVPALNLCLEWSDLDRLKLLKRLKHFLGFLSQLWGGGREGIPEMPDELTHGRVELAQVSLDRHWAVFSELVLPATNHPGTSRRKIGQCIYCCLCGQNLRVSLVSPSFDLILEGSSGLDQLILCEIILTGRWCGASQVPFQA